MSIEVRESYDYEYPLGLDWKPGSKLSKRIVPFIQAQARASKAEMSKRYPVWDKVDQKLTSYVAPAEKLQHKMQERDPDVPLTVVVPISYAILDTILTYWLTAFADGDLFTYDAVGPEDKPKAILMEHLINTQVRKAKMLLNVYVQWRDSIAYGLGVSALRWETTYGKHTIIEDGEIDIDPMGVPVIGKVRKSARKLTYEGSVLDNISVRNYFPDPSVPVHRVQDGEFVAFLTSKSYMKLLNMEKADPDSYFNVRYLRGQSGRSFMKEPISDSQLVHPDDTAIGEGSDVSKTQPIDVLSFYCTIIPAEWGLGKSIYPEKWLFEVAGADTVIRAQPLNLNHNLYPITVCAPTFDGYTVAPVSLIEIIWELSNAIDWLYRSRFHNVCAGLKHSMVIDPWLARYDQAVSSEPATAICIRQHVWGRGVANAVEQLRVYDVTQSHIQDIGHLSDIIQRVTGAVDSIQGVVRPTGERRSATEMRDTRLSAISRIQKGARLGSIQAMYDLGLMLAHHLQQFMSQDTYVHLTGETAKDLIALYNAEYVPVSPADIVIDFDLIPSDAVTPGGEFLPEIIQMFQLSQSHPVTAQSFNPVRQMLDIYRRAGVKGAYQFLVLPDDEAARTAREVGATPLAPPSALEGTLNAAPRPV